MKDPKGSSCIAFSPDGKYLAVVTRRDCRDHLSIYSSDKMELLNDFKIDTVDAEELKWSPDSSSIALRDTCIDYNVVVYALDGNKLVKFVPYEDALGAKCISWSPSGEFLAIGSYDGKVRLLNNVTWRCVATFTHKKTVSKADVLQDIFKELTVKESNSFEDALLEKENSHTNKMNFTGTADLSALLAADKISAGDEDTCYKIATKPVNIPAILNEAAKSKLNPKFGVGNAIWSSDNRFLATRCEDMPFTVFIWDIAQIKLAAVVVQYLTVSSFSWDPLSTRLSICCNNGKIYFWSMDGASWVNIPSEMKVVRNEYYSPTFHPIVFHHSSFIHNNYKSHDR